MDPNTLQMAPKPMTKKIPAAAIHPFASATLTNISNWSGDESLSIADWRNGEAAVGEIGINRHFQDVPEKNSLWALLSGSSGLMQASFGAVSGEAGCTATQPWTTLS
jgi:hypothetical protein